MRNEFSQQIEEILQQLSNTVLITGDLGFNAFENIQEMAGDRFINAGVAEQNMIGVAAGLAKDGFVVFATSFAPFITMRASEQIRMNLGYMNLNVKAVSIGSGVSMAFLGNSHFGLEDASIMRSIPNITVVSPADCAEIVKTVFAAADFEGPMYIRLTGAVNNPVVYKDDYDFKIGKAVTIKEGHDITIFANGTMVYESLEASKILESHGISASVINMHTIKPLDTEAIDKAIKTSSLIVSVEEHNVIGGLGGAIAEYKTQFNNAPPQLILGLPDIFLKRIWMKQNNN